MKKKRIAWLLAAVFCLSMVVFSGCGSSEEPEETAESPYPMTIEDNEYFKFEIVENDEAWGEYTYKITNKTDQDITFDGEKAIINGSTTVDAFIYSDLAAGTSAKDTFYLDDEELSDFGEDEELVMTVQYNVYNSDFDDITSGSFDFTIPK